MSIPAAVTAQTIPAPAKKQASPTTPSEAKASSDLEDSSGAYELDEKVAPRTTQRDNPCPNCLKPLLSRDATFCVECGYNLKTGWSSGPKDLKPKNAAKRSKGKSSKFGEFIVGRLTSGKFLGGMASLIGGLVWLVVGLLAERIFFYPLFLIIGGFFSMISGLISGDE